MGKANSGTRLRGSSGKFTSSKGFFSTSTLQRGLAQFELKMREHIEQIAEDFAQELVDYAQTHAPWDDRTGDAREGLSVQVESARGGNILVTLFHTVDYGVWLEVRWGGKYAIIIPTVEQKGPELLARMQHMMDRIIFYE